MSDERTHQIEHWMREFASKSDAQIRAELGGWKPHAEGYIAGEMVLQQRAEARDPTRPLLTSLNERVSTIDGRLANVEQVATRSEFRTWGFWFGVIAIIIALLSLFRDYFGLSSPAPASAVAPQQIAPTVTTLSSGIPRPYSTLSQAAPVASTAIVQQATGSTSTPPRLMTPGAPSLATPTTRRP